MRFEVPQFIEIEDKVVGPLTWRQFVYLAGGVGILLVLYFAPIPKVFFIFIGLPIAGLSGFLAFHRVNNRPFSIFLESFVNYTTRKKLYLWKRDQAQTVTEITSDRKAAPKHPAEMREKTISSLSHKLEHIVPE
jgi:hypothetical protein